LSPEQPGFVVALFGPTGVGKTAVGVEVGRRLGVRIISCDSMQLYPDFPVLTNQPGTAEMAAAPHVLVREQGDRGEWNVALYAERAWQRVDEDLSAHGWALLVGGTGLYLRAALAPLGVAAGRDPQLRASLEERARLEGPEVLHAELAVLDPAAGAAIHPRNARRIVRALEVLACGTEGVWSGRDDLWRPVYRHPSLVVGLVMDREILYERVNRRVREMVAGGAPDEVRRYRARKAEGGAGPEERVSPEVRGVEQAIGFRELSACLDGTCGIEEAIERISAATRRYVRRQWTWMRRLQDAVIIDVTARTPADVAGEVVRSARVRRSGGS
jgi:tRNA dimethylallyltransferase